MQLLIHLYKNVTGLFFFLSTVASFEGNLNQEEREVCAVVSHNVEPDTGRGA